MRTNSPSDQATPSTSKRDAGHAASVGDIVISQQVVDGEQRQSAAIVTGVNDDGTADLLVFQSGTSAMHPIEKSAAGKDEKSDGWFTKGSAPKLERRKVEDQPANAANVRRDNPTATDQQLSSMLPASTSTAPSSSPSPASTPIPTPAGTPTPKP